MKCELGKKHYYTVYIATGNKHLDNDTKVMFRMTLTTLPSFDQPVPSNSFTAKKIQKHL